MQEGVIFSPTFLSLEEDFVESKMAINNRINSMLYNEDTSTSSSQVTQASILEAERCIKMMSIELRGKAPHIRKAMQAKINLYREELQGLIRDMERAKLMSKEVQSAPKRSDNREQILQNTSRLMKSSKTLENSRKLVSETEEIGISIMDNLAQQRESLLSAHEKVRETHEMTGDARKILQRMTRRLIANNIVLWSVIIMLFASICLVIYHDFIKPTVANDSSIN